MLRIECESCHAPYHVDERRVPPQGLKMRCPKCGHTFAVQKPGAAAPEAPPPRAAPPPPKANVKATMLGLGKDDAGLPAARTGLPKAPPVPPRPPAAPVAAPRPAAPPDADLPAARPAPPRAGPSFGKPPVAPRPAGRADDVPLPARRPGPPVGAAPRPPMPAAKAAPPAPPPPDPNAGAELDLPAPRDKFGSLPAALSSVDDFPVVREPPAKAKAKATALGLGPSAEPAFGEVDLPAVAADLPAARAGAPAGAADLPAARAGARAGAVDLPAARAGARAGAVDLPAARPAAPRAGAKPGAGVSFELDLPNPKQAAKKGPDELEFDLGPPAADLPLPLPDLPVVAESLPARPDKVEPAFGEIDLPSIDAQLPQAASALPMVAPALPQVASALPQVADVLPVVGQQLPAPVADEMVLPAEKQTLDFGEVDLGALGGAPQPAPALPPLAPALPPLVPPLVSRATPPPAAAAIAELDLGAGDLQSVPPSKPPMAASAPPAPAPEPPPVQAATSALAYGELDLGAQASAPMAPIQTEEAPLPPPAGPMGGDELSLPQAPPPPSPMGAPGGGAIEASLPIQTGPRPRGRDIEKTPSRAPRIMLGVFVVLLVVGGLLQLTRHGAFGYLTISDKLHAKEYASIAKSDAARARARSLKDVYPETRGAVDDLFAAHWNTPRAAALGAYAAFAEFAYEARFGSDVDRNAKAKLILADAAKFPNVPHLALAQAAEAAAEGDVVKARKGLEAASKRDPGDPIQRDIALLRGEVELSAHDVRAAKTAFETALKLGAKAQAHYGLARVAMAGRDWENVAKECDATLAATPHHPGALLLRALERYTEKGDDTGALADLEEIVSGPAKRLASQDEVAQAHANRGRIFLASGRAGDARAAFAAALKLDPHNGDALVGQGTVYFEESRYTEALTRFDTALQARPRDELATSYDALTKIKLERLKEAKDQLLAARATFPKSMRIMFALAQADVALGNSGDAEKELRQAIDWASPKDPESVAPYIALATLLSSRNRDKEAAEVIEDGKSKLPDQAPVAVAFGEYDAAQGKYDDAVAHFKHALELSPSSLSTHFKLGVTYRHMRKPDLASQEFDQVLAIDKDYPGLALERGLLFEESGEVERALEQFKNALARAPNDADLQLRVGAAYVAIGQPEKALPMLRKVLEKRPTSAEANHYLGRAIFANEGATTEAMRYLKRAVELDPNRAEYHLYVGWAANEANPAELGLAEQEIKRALALDKLLADAYWQRGELERKHLAVDDALADERHALELRPSRIAAYATMAECYEDKNDPQSALDNWAKAVAGNERNAYWRYRYGKLLLDRGRAGEAAPHLTFAVEDGLKKDVRPPWIAPAEFAAADALRRTGKRQEAVTMYRRYLEVASMNDPDRRDALNALMSLGETYRPGP
jgi:predicted Zn finger-like uncharacterized protein